MFAHRTMSTATVPERIENRVTATGAARDTVRAGFRRERDSRRYRFAGTAFRGEVRRRAGAARMVRAARHVLDDRHADRKLRQLLDPGPGRATHARRQLRRSHHGRRPAPPQDWLAHDAGTPRCGGWAFLSARQRISACNADQLAAQPGRADGAAELRAGRLLRTPGEGRL